MKVTDVFLCESVQLFDLKEVGNCFFKSDFVSMIHFHKDYVEDIDSTETIDCVVFNNVADKEIRHDSKVDQKEN